MYVNSLKTYHLVCGGSLSWFHQSPNFYHLYHVYKFNYYNLGLIIVSLTLAKRLTVKIFYVLIQVVPTMLTSCAQSQGGHSKITDLKYFMFLYRVSKWCSRTVHRMAKAKSLIWIKRYIFRKGVCFKTIKQE